MKEGLKAFIMAPVKYADITITLDVPYFDKGDSLLFASPNAIYSVHIEGAPTTKTINNIDYYEYRVDMPSWTEMEVGTMLTYQSSKKEPNPIVPSSCPSYHNSGHVPTHTLPYTEKKQGLRFNSNKIRMDLVPYSAIEGIAKVLTYGANKYTIKDEEGNIITKGDNNWKLGMPWLDVYASLDRHLGAWLKGEDYDESGELHIDHVLTNAAFIKEYMSIYPEGDNRDHWYNKPIKKVWLDLDGVCFDFEPHFLKWFNLPDHHPTDWNDYRFRDNISSCTDDFWAQCPIIEGSNVLPYPIAGYCTARNCSDEIIKATLDKHGFPAAPIINVGVSGSKVEALKSAGCEVFIDDSINNFTALNAAGILCYLMERPHNLKYDVGSRRCKNLKEFVNKIKLLN
jgi:hypothetical protein